MAQAKITVPLPDPVLMEGFFLPSLEAMALSDLAIVPYCRGNENFCIDGKNCLRPSYDAESILDAIDKGMFLLHSHEIAKYIKKHALNTCSYYTLRREREEFYECLKEMVYVGC
jgi:hypothetical protein